MQTDLCSLKLVQTDLAVLVGEIDGALVAYRDDREQALDALTKKLDTLRTAVGTNLLNAVTKLETTFDEMVDPLIWTICDADSHEQLATVRYTISHSRSEVLKEWLEANHAEPGDVYISLEREHV